MYVIPGDPVPLARARIGHGAKKMYDSQKELKLHAGIYVQSQLKQPYRPPEGPLHLDVTFFMRIPRKIHTKRNIDKNYTYHFFRPDLDNLVKFILDTVQTILFKDDAQISSITARKIYHENPRTEFTIQPYQKDEKFSS